MSSATVQRITSVLIYNCKRLNLVPSVDTRMHSELYGSECESPTDRLTLTGRTSNSRTIQCAHPRTRTRTHSSDRRAPPGCPMRGQLRNTVTVPTSGREGGEPSTGTHSDGSVRAGATVSAAPSVRAARWRAPSPSASPLAEQPTPSRARGSESAASPRR